MYAPQCEEIVDHAVPPTNQWVGGKITSNQNSNDQEAGEDKKADWPGHLAEIVQAYNAIRSAVTGYSPHYLCLDEGLGSKSTFTSPPLGVQRPP